MSRRAALGVGSAGAVSARLRADPGETERRGLSGHGVGSAGLKRVRWTLSAGGALRREYRYALEGDFVYHGVTFDHWEELILSLRWLGEGPFRVGENCLQGTGCGDLGAACRKPRAARQPREA